MNFYCVKVGTRYDSTFVIKLENMIAKNYRGDFKFSCITDDKTLPSHIHTIEMPDLGLEKWWAKMVLFDELFIEQGFFFDLDVVITGDITNLWNPGKVPKFLHTDWVDLNQLHVDTIGNKQRYCSINSSILMWNQMTKRHHIWQYFMKNKNKIMDIFTGIDSFIEHRFPDDYELMKKPEAVHILLDKKQDELGEDPWIQKHWN